MPQFGLIAEEVAQVDPGLVMRDPEGLPFTVRYEAVNAMLLNEFLKEHRRVQEQGRGNQERGREIAARRKELEEMKAQMAEMRRQLENGSPKPPSADVPPAAGR
jgi:hypothetical protein